MTHQAEVQQTADELRGMLDAYKGDLAEQVLKEWENVLAMLKEATELLDPERPAGADRRAYRLVEEAERVLREELGRMSMPFLPQDLRYAALDAHKRLYRRVLT